MRPGIAVRSVLSASTKDANRRFKLVAGRAYDRYIGSDILSRGCFLRMLVLRHLALSEPQQVIRHRFADYHHVVISQGNFVSGAKCEVLIDFENYSRWLSFTWVSTEDFAAMFFRSEDVMASAGISGGL